MQPEIIIPSQSERQAWYDITHIWDPNQDPNEPIYRAERDSRKQRTHWGLPSRGREWGKV